MTLALTITMTNAGLRRFTAAQLGAGIDLAIASVGLTDTDFVVAPTLEALPGEFRRIDMISGKAVGDNVVHLTMRDDDEVGYTARGFGLFLTDGTLFAVYGQADRLFEKSPLTTFLAAIDLAFPTADIDRLTFGNTDFLNPPATTTTMGVVELATQTEANTGTDTRRVAPVSVMKTSIALAIAQVTAAIAALSASVDQRIAAAVAAIGQALDGLAARTVYGSGLVSGGGRNDTNRTLTVTAATSAQVRDGFATDVAVTPRALADAMILRLVESSENLRSLSDGTVEQWGTHAVPANEGAFELVFPRPFPEKCYGVFCTVLNAGGSTNGQTTIQEMSLQADRANLFAQNHQATNNDATGFRWRAWGR